MDDSILYRNMCYKVDILQDTWNPKEGDVFVLKSSYCGSYKSDCNEDNICPDCLRMCNQFIISESHIDKYYLFNPTLCVRGNGCMLNSTSASILVTDKKYIDDIQPFNTHIDDVFWIPRQDQLQKIVMYEENYSIYGLQYAFSSYLSDKAGEFTTLDQYWLAFTMDTLEGLAWNGEHWIKITA